MILERGCIWTGEERVLVVGSNCIDERKKEEIHKNMKKMMIFILSVHIINMLFISNAFSKEAASEDYIEKITKVENAKWEDREELINEIQLKKSKLTEIEKNKIIDVFNKESSFQEKYINSIKQHGFTINEALDRFNDEYGKKGYARYFINFTKFISAFHDVRTISGLLRAIHDYGGAIVPTQVINMGDRAIEPLLTLTNSDDRTLKNTAMFVLSVWVNAPKVTEDYSLTKDMVVKDKKLLNSIKATFIDKLHDADVDVRSRAVYGLSAFSEEIVIRELEEVSRNDPYLYYNKYSKRTEYPVRDSARRSVEKLKSKIRLQ